MSGSESSAGRGDAVPGPPATDPAGVSAGRGRPEGSSPEGRAPAGAPYRDRLLGLPGFLLGRGGGGKREVARGLELTGYFLERHVFRPQDRLLPPPRRRLPDHFRVDGA